MNSVGRFRGNPLTDPGKYTKFISTEDSIKETRFPRRKFLGAVMSDFIYDEQRGVLIDIRYLFAFLRPLFQKEHWRANEVAKS